MISRKDLKIKGAFVKSYLLYLERWPKLCFGENGNVSHLFLSRDVGG